MATLFRGEIQFFEVYLYGLEHMGKSTQWLSSQVKTKLAM